MKLTIVSGRSGSGKSTALHALEDAGYSCIDNFPIDLLQPLMRNAIDRGDADQPHAVCIDARTADLDGFPATLVELDRMGVDCQVIYLDALSPTLVKRFSETRRKHPLSNAATDLKEAIDAEQTLLEGIADLADLTVDTTHLTAQALIEHIRDRVIENSRSGLSLTFRSFGFKYGVPVDADFVFDVRCLPNPHWVPELRPQSGMDLPVREYLEAQPLVQQMYEDIKAFVDRWRRCFEENNRTYLTFAIGCTGGQHRSVYLSSRLGEHFQQSIDSGIVLVRHRELNRS
ncbi:MAG: RNase adapter RapZ [Pseudomonadota bacterium]